MTLIPQTTAQLPSKLNASFRQLSVENLPYGAQYDLVVRDAKTGFLFFNIEGHEFSYDPADRLLTVDKGRVLISNELAAELGATTSSSSGCGGRSNTKRCTCMPMTR